jgi:hypothetical protein
MKISFFFTRNNNKRLGASSGRIQFNLTNDKQKSFLSI